MGISLLSMTDFGIKLVIRKAENAEIIDRNIGSSKPAYGLAIPDDAIGGISARLIWNSSIYLGPLEYLMDRSEVIRANEVQDFEGLEIFFTKIMSGFRPWASSIGMDWDSSDYVLVSYENKRAFLTCNSSYGYVYASVWEEKQC